MIFQKKKHVSEPILNTLYKPDIDYTGLSSKSSGSQNNRVEFVRLRADVLGSPPPSRGRGAFKKVVKTKGGPLWCTRRIFKEL